MSIKKYHQRKTLVICVVLLFITGLLISHLQGQFRLRQVLGQKGPLVHEVWNKTYGGMYSDAAYSMKVTSDGDFIILGTTASFGCYNRDVWLLKTDVDGTEEWNRTFDGIDGFDSGSDILITNNDGYVIAGVLSDLPPPPDEQFIIDGWLIKTNQTGYEEWNRSFGGGDDDFFHSVQQTADGGYAILGETMSFGSGGFDLWLVKTDSNGNELWNKTYGTSLNEYGESLLVTSDNGLILVGIKIVSDDIEVWVIKTDSMGNIDRGTTHMDRMDGIWLNQFKGLMI